MKKTSLMFKIIWSIVLVVVATLAYLLYSPMRDGEFMRFMFAIHFILPPLAVVIFAIIFKRKVFLVIPVTASIYIAYNFGRGVLIYLGLTQHNLDEPFWATISYAFGTNGEYIYDFIFTDVLFFVWLTIYATTYKVFELEKYISKINFKWNKIAEK